jgi:hypothetical protein
VTALASSAATARLPTPGQLARLGTVLCLYPAGAGGELGGWSRAVCAEAAVPLHGDGLEDCIAFRDTGGGCCWKLYLLPDSDFLAWERLVARLPLRADADTGPALGIGEHLLQRLVGRRHSGNWHASVLRLRALGVPGASPPGALAAVLAPVSPAGAAAARAIARRANADASALVDDCCCLRAARASPGGRGRPDAAAAIELRPPPAPRSQALRPDPSRFDSSRPRTHA